jgi:hypothetical protein
MQKKNKLQLIILLHKKKEFATNRLLSLSTVEINSLIVPQFWSPKH